MNTFKEGELTYLDVNYYNAKSKLWKRKRMKNKTK